MTPNLNGFERLLVALLIGLLIGLDRERAEIRKHHPLFAGVRTFPLIALSGAIAVMLIETVGAILLVASFIAFAALTVVAYYRGSTAGQVGATTEVAALLTFLLGALAGTGQLLLAGGAGIVVAVLLVAKPPLENFSRALRDEELTATLELAVISCIVLPLLPNRTYGPWDVLNPFEVWLVVVLVSGVSFAGFIAMRLVGEQRGTVLAGLVGALVSSTAVTAAMANQSRDSPGSATAAASATVLASAVMCLRMTGFAAAVGPGILPRLVPAVAAMTVVGALAAWIIGKTGKSRTARTTGHGISNPFRLSAAMTFAALYALVSLIVPAAQQFLGSSGIYVAAALSSLVDVDAVTIALSRAGPQASSWREPAAAVTLAAVVNTLTKLGIAVGLGAGPFRTYVAAGLAAMAITGAAAGLLVLLKF